MRSWNWKVISIVAGLLFTAVALYNVKAIVAWWEGLSGVAIGLVLSAFVGTACSLLASWIFNSVAEATWRKDVGAMESLLNDIKANMVVMNDGHNAVVATLPEALGGSFTKSLLGYYPHSSAGIAKILSDQMWKTYQRHYRRVIVRTGRDTYKLNSLMKYSPKSGGEAMVWKTSFHVHWEWFNDSKVPKSPLVDLMLIVAAPKVALDNFEHGNSEVVRKKINDDYSDYFLHTENYIRSIVADPIDPSRPIASEALPDLFKIDSMTVSIDGKESKTFKKDDLVEVPQRDLKTGVYRALKIREVPDELRQLPVGKSMHVEYTGTMILPTSAQKGPNGYGGEIVFPPSDIVEGIYVLSMVYPKTMTVDEKKFKLSVDRENSGCRYLHEHFEVQPSEADPKDLPTQLRPGANDSATCIYIETPLTDSHIIALRWKAIEVNTGRIPLLPT